MTAADHIVFMMTSIGLVEGRHECVTHSCHALERDNMYWHVPPAIGAQFKYTRPIGLV